LSYGPKSKTTVSIPISPLSCQQSRPPHGHDKTTNPCRYQHLFTFFKASIAVSSYFLKEPGRLIAGCDLVDLS